MCISEIRKLDAGERVKEKYLITDFLGEGGLAYNYCAIQTRGRKRKVVLKQTKRIQELNGAISDDRFQVEREFRMLKQLKHPSLPEVHELFEEDRTLYFTREYRDGVLLEDMIKKGLDRKAIRDISFQVLGILEYLHKKNIIYRDLKPSNILVENSGRIFLFDFGTIRYYKPGKEKDTIALGTPGFAAPEQYGKAQTDARSDIYSFGALLYYMLTKDNPEDNPFRIGEPDNIKRRDLTKKTEEILIKCLSLSPAERYQSIGELTGEIFSEEALGVLSHDQKKTEKIGSVLAEYGKSRGMLVFMLVIPLMLINYGITLYFMLSRFGYIVVFLIFMLLISGYAVVIVDFFNFRYYLGTKGIALKSLFSVKEYLWSDIKRIIRYKGTNSLDIHLLNRGRISVKVDEFEEMAGILVEESGRRIETFAGRVKVKRL